MIEATNINKQLVCELTDDERQAYGIQLATTLEDMYQLDVEKKRTMESFKDRLGGLQSTADSLRAKVSAGQEVRTVECEVRLGVPDPEHKQVVRLDTGEVVESLPMTNDDKQAVMEFEDDGEPEEETGTEDDGEGFVDVESEPMPEGDDDTPESESDDDF